MGLFKEKKIYSKINEIKFKKAKDTLMHGTLVLEGGAFRGLYTSGVLDCLMDHNINLDNVIGISAGALNGVNYLAGCRGRTAHCLLKHRFDPRYLGWRALKESGSIVNFRYIFEDYNKDQELDEERLFRNDRHLYAGCANLNTGEVDYIETKDRTKFFKSVTASASMPLVSMMVRIDGNKYLDGGCITKLPIRFAIENKFDKIIFVATRPLDYRRKLITPELKLEKIRYRNYPKFIEALKNTNKKYNQDAEFLELLASRGGIFVIAPSKYIAVSRLEGDEEKMGELYMLGYNDCNEKLGEIENYLNI